MLGKKGPLRISEADRRHALTQLDALKSQGYIHGQHELDARQDLVRQAAYRADLDRALEGLPKIGARDFTRASDEDRTNAVRRLQMHMSAGHLSTSEAEDRVKILGDCQSREEIEQVLADLPELGGAGGSHFLPQATRDKALQQLLDHLKAGRLTETEYTIKREQVAKARTRKDIDEAFTNLRGQRLTETINTAGDFAHGGTVVLTEASRRLRAVLVRAFVAVAVALGGIYLIVTGDWKLGIGVLLLSLLGLLYSAAALVQRSKR